MDELTLLTGLRQGNTKIFSLLFEKYYRDLVLFAGSFRLEQATCEDIVQSVFLKLWNDRSNLEIITSLRSYLLSAVRNGCLDEIRHQAIVNEHKNYSYTFTSLEDADTENYILYSDLKDHFFRSVGKTTGKLPAGFPDEPVRRIKI